MEPRATSERRAKSLRVDGSSSKAIESRSSIEAAAADILIRFEIPGNLPGENEIIAANRSYYTIKRKRIFVYNSRKEEIERLILLAVFAQVSPNKRREPILEPFEAHFHWVEKNSRRDPDNVAAGCKFIFDALVDGEIISGDRRKNVKSIFHNFETDSKNPRVIVTLKKTS